MSAPAARPLRRAAGAAAAVGVLLGLALGAAAKAPPTSQAPSMDWLRDKLRRDRAEAARRTEASRVERELKAFRDGEGPLAVAAAAMRVWIEDTSGKAREEDRRWAAEAFVARFRLEQTRMDPEKLRPEKDNAVRTLLHLITDDRFSQDLFALITEALYPKNQPTFVPGSPPRQRKKSLEDWTKYVKER